MGKRGPKPLPSNVKKLRGTFRFDRAPDNEPEPKIKIPSRPTWLGKKVPWGREAIREWDRIAPILAKNKLLTDLDRSNLAAYCDALAQWWHWRRELAEYGSTQESPNGFIMPRPEVAFMNKSLDNLRKFSALFGLSPSDRTRISVPEEKEEPSSPFGRFGGKTGS